MQDVYTYVQSWEYRPDSCSLRNCEYAERCLCVYTRLSDMDPRLYNINVECAFIDIDCVGRLIDSTSDAPNPNKMIYDQDNIVEPPIIDFHDYKWINRVFPWMRSNESKDPLAHHPRTDTPIGTSQNPHCDDIVFVMSKHYMRYEHWILGPYMKMNIGAKIYIGQDNSYSSINTLNRVYYDMPPDSANQTLYYTALTHSEPIVVDIPLVTDEVTPPTQVQTQSVAIDNQPLVFESQSDTPTVESQSEVQSDTQSDMPTGEPQSTVESQSEPARLRSVDVSTQVASETRVHVTPNTPRRRVGVQVGGAKLQPIGIQVGLATLQPAGTQCATPIITVACTQTEPPRFRLYPAVMIARYEPKPKPDVIDTESQCTTPTLSSSDVMYVTTPPRVRKPKMTPVVPPTNHAVDTPTSTSMSSLMRAIYESTISHMTFNTSSPAELKAAIQTASANIYSNALDIATSMFK